MKAFGSFFLLKYFVKRLFGITFDPAARPERLFGVAGCQRVRQATFWCRCVPAAPSSDFLASLRASGLVKRLFGVAACQRLRQATFWRRCEPAAPSCDILGSLGASGTVMRHFGEPVCQRHRHATFWGACVPAVPSCDILGSTFDPPSPVSESPAIERRSAPASTAAPLYIKV